MCGRSSGLSARRREILRIGGLGLVGLAGCAGLTEEDATPEESDSVTSTRSPATPQSGSEPVRVLAPYPGRAWRRSESWNLTTTFTDTTGTEVEVTTPFRTASVQFARLPAGEPSFDVVGSTLPRLFDQWTNGRFVSTADIVDRMRDHHGGFVVEPYGHRDKVWTTPHGYRATTFVYRRDVYEELGLEPPSSFTDVLENARAIDQSDRSLAGYALPGESPGEYASAERVKSRHEFQTYLARMGISPVGLRWQDPDRRRRLEVHFPERQVTALLEFFEELADYSPDPSQIGWDTAASRWLASGRPREPQFVQQLHCNNALTALAAASAENEDITGDQRNQFERVAGVTGITTLPLWQEGGVDRTDSWLSKPELEGYLLVENGPNVPGARELLSWLYATDAERTRRLYHPPSPTLPAVEGVIESTTYRQHPLFAAWPRVLDQAEYVRNTVLDSQYGLVSEANLTDPVAIEVGRHGFYGEMVHRVVTGNSSPRDAYEWGRTRLETKFEDARATFREA